MFKKKTITGNQRSLHNFLRLLCSYIKTRVRVRVSKLLGLGSVNRIVNLTKEPVDVEVDEPYLLKYCMYAIICQP